MICCQSYCCATVSGGAAAWDQLRLTRRFERPELTSSIAFAGSSPPRPLRHVAAGLDGGRPGEGKDIWEVGDWQDNIWAYCDSWLTLTVLAQLLLLQLLLLLLLLSFFLLLFLLPFLFPLLPLIPLAVGLLAATALHTQL